MPSLSDDFRNFANFELQNNKQQRTQYRTSLVRIQSPGGLNYATLEAHYIGGAAPFAGAEIVSVRHFGQEALSRKKRSIEFTARLRIPLLRSGAVAAFYIYGPRGDKTTGDEIDFEFLGKPTYAGRNVGVGAKAVWLNTFEGFDDDKKDKRNPRYRDALYNYETLGTNVPSKITKGKANWYRSWHWYKIRWTPGRSLVEWFIKTDGADPYFRLHYAHKPIPNQPMQIHFNVWVPDSSWREAYNSRLISRTLRKNALVAQMDVDQVKVSFI
jgi:beta-glucanase (GH16 family)